MPQVIIISVSFMLVSPLNTLEDFVEVVRSNIRALRLRRLHPTFGPCPESLSGNWDRSDLAALGEVIRLVRSSLPAVS